MHLPAEGSVCLVSLLAFGRGEPETAHEHVRGDVDDRGPRQLGMLGPSEREPGGRGAGELGDQLDPLFGYLEFGSAR